jgi:hypothetical protein
LPNVTVCWNQANISKSPNLTILPGHTWQGRFKQRLGQTSDNLFCEAKTPQRKKEPAMDKKLNVTVPIEITLEKVSNLLCAGMEGGINYWAMIDDYIEPETVWHGKGASDTFRHIDYPLSDGGAVIILECGDDCDEDDAPKHRLDLAAIRRGLEVMAREAPQHFADFLNDNDDADTGDVFVQCCLLGEIRYG